MRLINCGLTELSLKLTGKKVICFGAGRYIEDFIKRFPESDFMNQILCFWDNDSCKWGMTRHINQKVYNICRPGDGLDGLKNIVIVVASIYYKNIIQQISRMQKCTDIECYVLEFLKLDYYDSRMFSDSVERSDSDIKLPTGNIPKKIHYFWFGKKPLPDRFERNIDTWRNFCPDYEIIRWDESNYDITVNKYMEQAYKAQKWGFVPDYARLDVINLYGGIYLDTDVELVRGLDDLLGYKAFCGFQTGALVNFGQGFGAEKNQEIIKKVMSLYDDLEFIMEDGSLNMVASPKYLTDILMELGLKKKNVTQKVGELTVFPTTYFCPKSLYYGLTHISPLTCSIHHFAASWFEEGQSFYQDGVYKDVLYETHEGEVYRYEEWDEDGERHTVFG